MECEPIQVDQGLWGVDAGLRQMRRTRASETCEFDVGEGGSVVAPTAPEVLRIKAFLVVQRNVEPNYLDVVALAEPLGFDTATEILSDIDSDYVDRSGERGSVLTSLVISLTDSKPRDTEVIDVLPRYKGLDVRYHPWDDVVEVCRTLALRLGGAV